MNDARKLTMPAHHDVRAKDVDLKRLGAVLAVAHEQDLRDFASLLLVVGSFLVLAKFSGAPPGSTYVPAHIEDGKFVPGETR